ncbi:plasmid pRiA4b ORF-3 family protein [Rhodococcus electrodiphilus]|uniref:IS1096 element passenger TnpR family protein n=1 Tax=Rhodococcus ruber TaxID=1830 RepID=UPI0026F44514|nr:plasmid pRiA4b ORF-3 family protein [Rhodococcus ruber]MDO2378399.1 plasmid pRiA4b ORF-3 family protein [Rhodococcus ruber]
MNQAEEFVVSVAHAIDALSRADSGFATTAWRSRDVDHLLERVLTSELVEDDDETRAHIAGDAAVFLQFLSATNRWTGQDEDLGYALSTLTSYIESRLASLPPTEVDEPPVEPEVERAALTVVPVVARLDALLGWIGERRPVTATGALKRALVMEAFDAVGGKREDLAPRKVQSMWDLPVLEQTWVVAAMVDLISIGKTVVKPGPAAPMWRDPDRNPGEYLALCRDAVTHSLIVALGRHGEGRLEAFHSALDEATAVVLSAGLGEHPLPSDPEERLHALPVLFPGMPVGPSFLGSMLVDRLEEFVADGILDDADGYRVPTPLRPAVRAAVRILLGDTAPVALHPPARCTLRISLRDSEPPVWRRVVVDNSLSLLHLHFVIQSCFAWEDYHLHQFTKGEPFTRGRVYVPDDQVDDELANGFSDVVDEGTVTIGTALPEAGATLTYLYDYGDGWTHDIVVESVANFDAEASRAACVDGHGLAPAEDSGGTWGWTDMLAAADDPAHERHDEVRQWLGLRAGERVDSEWFDADEVNGQLRSQFG